MDVIKIVKPQAALDELPDLLALVEEKTRQAKLPEGLIFKAQVVLEEIFVNVVNYAYDGKKGPMEINLQAEQNSLQIRVTDWGKPFNPLQQKQPDLQERFEKGIPGGAGLMLVRTMTASLAYTRIQDRNILDLTLDSSNQD
jgi:anti-sigma regulatory factor (Ser/Thr protein kinase)